MNTRLVIHPCNLEKRKRQIDQWRLPASVRRELREFLRDMGLGKVNRGLRISEKRQLKVLETLRIPLEFFHKPTARLTLRDVETFEQGLALGKIVSRFSGQPYADSTRSDIRKVFKMFLRWRLGEARALTLAGWLDTRCRPNTPEFLKEQEVEQLYRACGNTAQRFMIAVLFDAGARAEEFHNIRREDVQLPEGKENFVRITLKEEYSKTLGRTISLYWKYSTEAVQDYVRQRIQEGIKPGEPVFDLTYPAARKFLQRLGWRVLQRRIHFHLFRHSSATFYANRLNRQELCYRYGWKFSSNMPDVYISRAGMETKQLDEKFTQTELGSVKAEMLQLEQTAKIKDERIRQLEESMTVVNAQFAQVYEILSLTHDPANIQAALQRKRTKSKAVGTTGRGVHPSVGKRIAAQSYPSGQNKPQNKPE
jgi:integrase